MARSERHDRLICTSKQIRLVLWQMPAFKASDGMHPQHEADRAYFEQQGLACVRPTAACIRSGRSGSATATCGM